uniref:Uncharacterized protein n=1 Tax=Heterosigma akashiwo TaxID=2829 RepID=A0A6V1NUZ1_HETAK
MMDMSMGGCLSPIAWFTFPLMIVLFLLRISTTVKVYFRKTKRKNTYFFALHSSSVATIFCWILFEFAAIYTQCAFDCKTWDVKLRIGTWAAANTVQYLLYWLRWKTVVGNSRGLLGSPHDKAFLRVAWLIVVFNSVCVMYVLTNGQAAPVVLSSSSNQQQTVCDMDNKSKLVIAIYSGLDFLFGSIFFCLFISPLIRTCTKSFIPSWNAHLKQLSSRLSGQSNRISLGSSRTSLARLPSTDESSFKGGQLRTSADLKRVIRSSFLGFLISQAAQTILLMSAVLFAEDMRKHSVRLTSFMNVVGISLMFRDIQRCWAKREKKVKSAFNKLSPKRNTARNAYQVHCQPEGGAKAQEGESKCSSSKSAAYKVHVEPMKAKKNRTSPKG